MPVSPALNSQVLASVLAVMDVAPVSACLTLAKSLLFHVDDPRRSNPDVRDCCGRCASAYFAPRISLYRATSAGGVCVMRLITPAISSPERGLMSSCSCAASRR